MGVSPPTVRVALSALAAVGLIEARPGIGNFVRQPTESMAFKALFILESEASCLEILETRTALESRLRNWRRASAPRTRPKPWRTHAKNWLGWQVQTDSRSASPRTSGFT